MNLFNITKRIVWFIARKYNIKIEVPAFPHGRFPVEVEGGDYQIRHCIPSSVYFNTASGKIFVGLGTSFGHDVKLLTGKHLNVSEAEEQGENFHSVPNMGRDIVIGRNCFIGSGAIIIGPVEIGDYSVIGAGAIIVKNVEPYGFYLGSPARKVRDLKPNKTHE